MSMSGAVEFRVFAGTTSLVKILHHLATVLGLCRRAAPSPVPRRVSEEQAASQAHADRRERGAFPPGLPRLDRRRAARAPSECLAGSTREFPGCRDEALRLCGKFDERYPDARL